MVWSGVVVSSAVPVVIAGDVSVGPSSVSVAVADGSSVAGLRSPGAVTDSVHAEVVGSGSSYGSAGDVVDAGLEVVVAGDRARVVVADARPVAVDD